MSEPVRWMNRTRIEMRLARKGVRGVPLLGRYNYTRAEPGLPEHSHCGAMEICFLVRGRQTYRVGGSDYRLRGGDVFLTLPDEVHGTGGLPEEKGVLYWMVLTAPRADSSFLGLPDNWARSLWKRLQGIRTRHFRGSPVMKAHLDEITARCVEPRDPLAGLVISNRVFAFLLEVAACGAHPVRPERLRSLAPALRRIEENLGEPVSVPELAALTGLSVARFKTRFKEETGVPPGEYMLRARVDEARKRLCDGRGSITEIAFDLGFSSSQYFATVCKRFTGKSPSELRAG